MPLRGRGASSPLNRSSSSNLKVAFAFCSGVSDARNLSPNHTALIIAQRRNKSKANAGECSSAESRPAILCRPLSAVSARVEARPDLGRIRFAEPPVRHLVARQVLPRPGGSHDPVRLSLGAQRKVPGDAVGEVSRSSIAGLSADPRFCTCSRGVSSRRRKFGVGTDAGPRRSVVWVVGGFSPTAKCDTRANQKEQANPERQACDKPEVAIKGPDEVSVNRKPCR